LVSGSIDSSVDVRNTEINVSDNVGADSYGVEHFGTGASPELAVFDGLTISVSGSGSTDAIRIWEPDGDIIISNSVLDASSTSGQSIGLNFVNGPRDSLFRIRRSTLKGEAASMFADAAGSGSSTILSLSDLYGPFIIPNVNAGTFSCAGVVDQNNNFYADSCPP
jgi:hypothetical protein